MFDRRDYITTRSRLPRSGSIDNVAEWGLTGRIGNVGGSVNTVSNYGLLIEHAPRRSPSPLLGVRGDRLSLVSPNIGRRVKGHRAIVGKLLQNDYYTYTCVFLFKRTRG